jgi:hypothetical protein
VRALRNLGYALGGLISIGALTVGGRGAFVVVILANAASFVLVALLYSTLPTTAVSVRPEGGRLQALRDARYLGLMLSSTVFATSLVLLDVGIPLWIAERTAAPRALVGVVVTINTVLVVLLQVRASRGAETPAGSVKLLHRAALSFVLCCGFFALSSQVGVVAASAFVVLGAIALTWGEMLESPAWWTISFELAPAERRTEYLGAFALNYELVAIAGPALMALLVQSGAIGWGVLAAAFVASTAAARALVPRSPD